MNQKTQRILEVNGVDKVAFYGSRSPVVNNIFTACVFINTRLGRIESRGVAICSLKDSFSKKKGKQKAFGRALKALVHKTNDLKIRAAARDDELVRRRLKIKTFEDELTFRELVTEELRQVDPTMRIQTIQNPGDKYKKYYFNLPLSYPVRLTNSLFKYKSQYLPEAVGSEELKLLRECTVFTEPIYDPVEDIDSTLQSRC